MKPELYTQLREKITALLPDLLNLEFGCEVDAGEMGVHTVVGKTIEAVTIALPGRHDEIQTLYTAPHIEEILGRPILLSDVLRAIQSTLKIHDNVSIWADSNVAEITVERGTYDGEGNYSDFKTIDLSKPHLSDQSDEFAKWLLTLLK